uniref:Gustatory receptor n=1 Tax=Stomoxys calcitrans TaxID=35570 RepID=A0A454A0N7_STOCA
MRTCTRCLIASCYYASQLLGILAFRYHPQTGRVNTTRRLTIFCAAMSLTLLAIIIKVLVNFDWNLENFLAYKFHLKVRITVFLIRMCAVSITVILNWQKRGQFMTTLNEFQLLQQKFQKKWPISQKVENDYDEEIAIKIVGNLFSNIFMSLELYVVFKPQLQWSNFFISVMALMVIVENMAMLHFYIAIADINVLLAILNEQLQRICQASPEIFNHETTPFRPGMDQYLLLSHELNTLALYHLILVKFINRVTALYEIQGSCVLLAMYMNHAAIIYASFMFLYHDYNPSKWSEWSTLVTSLALFFYFLDMRAYRTGILRTQEKFVEMVYLLKSRELYWPVLEESQQDSLENSFKNFSLQLAKFPVEMKLVGLFKFDRSMAFSIFGSTISNAIVLIQYDYKNNSDE